MPGASEFPAACAAAKPLCRATATLCVPGGLRGTRDRGIVTPFAVLAGGQRSVTLRQPLSHPADQRDVLNGARGTGASSIAPAFRAGASPVVAALRCAVALASVAVPPRAARTAPALASVHGWVPGTCHLRTGRAPAHRQPAGTLRAPMAPAAGPGSLAATLAARTGNGWRASRRAWHVRSGSGWHADRATTRHADGHGPDPIGQPGCPARCAAMAHGGMRRRRTRGNSRSRCQNPASSMAATRHRRNTIRSKARRNKPRGGNHGSYQPAPTPQPGMTYPG
jgi:hypothetical protein